jgi:DNA-binding response OmpR family regulator
MGKRPHGESLPSEHGYSEYACAVRNGEILQKGESPSPAARILLVDDEELICQACARLLCDFGYQTDTAEDGGVAWEALQANVYDLLITDINMPKVSGIELVNKVRSAHMALPVILMSGNLAIRKLDRNPWPQPYATLAKPFTGDELMGRVKIILRESDIRRARKESLPIFS